MGGPPFQRLHDDGLYRISMDCTSGDKQLGAVITHPIHALRVLIRCCSIRIVPFFASFPLTTNEPTLDPSDSLSFISDYSRGPLGWLTSLLCGSRKVRMQGSRYQCPPNLLCVGTLQNGSLHWKHAYGLCLSPASRNAPSWIPYAFASYSMSCDQFAGFGIFLVQGMPVSVLAVSN